MTTTSTQRRVARKLRYCESCPDYTPIQPGETYLVHTSFPGHDSGYADTAGHPVRIAECSDCATRYGRADLLGAVA